MSANIHPLDNPIWTSLSTHHRGLAQTAGDTLRYPAEVAPFLGVPQAGPVDGAALASLLRAEETVFLIGPQPAAPSGWRVEDLSHMPQMVCESPLPDVAGPAIVPLTERHRPLVLELTALVYPHYFRPRTMELGRYFGIFAEGRLAAMIGERMGFPGFREISAVCTHPDFVGQGLARRLLAYLTNDILQTGATPFLHVSPQNQRAIRLYAQNGYRTRSQVAFWSLRRQ
jgi:ribosomal protein S18 acetylase RimI-like enzyme